MGNSTRPVARSEHVAQGSGGGWKRRRYPKKRGHESGTDVQLALLTGRSAHRAPLDRRPPHCLRGGAKNRSMNESEVSMGIGNFSLLGSHLRQEQTL